MAVKDEHLIELQRRVASIPPMALAAELQKNAEALVEQRDSPGLHFAVGLLYARVGDFGSAAKMLSVAHNITGDNKVILGALAYLFANQVGDDETALTYLKKRHKMDRKDPSTLLIMAHCNLKLGKPETAIKNLDKAEKLNASGLQLAFIRAQALVQMDRFDDAEEIAASLGDADDAKKLAKTIRTQIKANRQVAK